MNYEFGAQVSGPSVVCHYAIEEIYLRVDSCHTDDLLADAVGPGPSVLCLIILEDVGDTASRGTACFGKRAQSFSRPQLRCDYPLNLSISVSGGKETNEDSLSNGE